MRHLPSSCARALFAALTLAVATAAQNATYGYFGAPARVGCSPVGTLVQHAAVGTPRLGTNFRVTLPGSNGDCSYLCNLWMLGTGFSNTSFQGLPLPWTPGPTGAPAPACGALMVSPDLIQPATAAAPGAGAQLTLTIPNNPNLTGLDFYQQPFTLTFVLRGLNSIAFGRGGHGTIGS